MAAASVSCPLSTGRWCCRLSPCSFSSKQTEIDELVLSAIEELSAMLAIHFVGIIKMEIFSMWIV